MSELLKYRLTQNLTQEELANKSGISVRTIQRIENGTAPKGYTLKALAKALDLQEGELLPKQKEEIKIDTQLLKYINLSSLVFIIFPPLNIVVPMLFAYYKKQNNPITKQIASIQFLWTVVSFTIFMLAVFIKKWLALNNKIELLTIMMLVLCNIYIILRNTLEIDKNKKLYFHMNFNIL